MVKNLKFSFLPWLIDRSTHRRPGQHHIYVCGYKGKENIDRPLELAVGNQTDRFRLAIDVIGYAPRFQFIHKSYVYEYGVDRKEIKGWKWPF